MAASSNIVGLLLTIVATTLTVATDARPCDHVQMLLMSLIDPE
jgi:hypothetical protein